MRPAKVHRSRWTQGHRRCQLPRTPPPSRNQPLYVLSGGDQQRLDVHLLQPPEPEPAQTMPVFGFTEQRLHPYPPLAQCFLVGEGATVALDLIHVALLKVAQHLATCLVVGASGSQRAGVAGARHGLVDDLVSGGSEGLRREDLARWTLVDVQFGVVGELLLAEIGSCFACSGQRHIGSNACSTAAMFSVVP